MTYANKTSVPVERSQGEIRKLLTKYDATGFAFGEQQHVAVVQFEMKARRVKFILPMPHKPSQGANQASIKTYDQVCRSRWRCLVLAIKAKLESVQSNIETFEDAFMAQIVLPNGQTVGQAMQPQIEGSYKSGKMPPLLGHNP